MSYCRRNSLQLITSRLEHGCCYNVQYNNFNSSIDSNAVFAIILNVLFAIPLFISFILVAIKRCHDINWSGWYSIGLFIPYLGFLMLAFLLFIKGDEENNQYGNSPYSLLKTLNHANNTTKNDTPPHSNWMNPEEDK